MHFFFLFFLFTNLYYRYTNLAPQPAPGDELGEITVMDKQFLLFLALDAYAVTGLFLLPFLLFASFSLLFRVWARCRSGRSHIIPISAC